jgi:hypothetical protein
MKFPAEYMAHWGVEFKHDGDPVVYKEFDTDGHLNCRGRRR